VAQVGHPNKGFIARILRKAVGADEMLRIESMTIIINDPPYGTERAWNALRLALASSSAAVKSNVNIFLLGTGFPRLRRDKIRLKATTT